MFSTSRNSRSQMFFAMFDECMFTTGRSHPTRPTPPVGASTKEKSL